MKIVLRDLESLFFFWIKTKQEQSHMNNLYPEAFIYNMQ